jgi:hypothetical protein
LQKFPRKENKASKKQTKHEREIYCDIFKGAFNQFVLQTLEYSRFANLCCSNQKNKQLQIERAKIDTEAGQGTDHCNLVRSIGGFH